MQVCTLLQTDNQASTPPLSFLQAGYPSCCPTNSIKALKALGNNKQQKFRLLFFGEAVLRLLRPGATAPSVPVSYATGIHERSTS